MSKDIKDYLHLYLGCVLVSKATNEKVGVLLGVVSNEAYFKERAGVVYSSGVSNYKPELRPLSDMSEEEKGELVINMPYKGTDKNYFNHLVYEQAASTLYLLSKHFDLFNLIPEGLAIDKTTLNQQ